MSNFFGGKSIPTSVVKELEARKKATALQEWFASRTTWVSITSMCEMCDSSIVTLANLKNAGYEDKFEYKGERPNPVIQSVKVSAQGNLGTTRKATITLLAFNEDQLNRLADCYLISGMSIRLEFGWSIGATGDRAPSPISADRKTSNVQAICQISKQRESYPMYDGLQGIVGKWNISYNVDGQYWEVTIDMIAASSPVLGLPVNDMSATCVCTQKQVNPSTNKEEEVKVEKSALQSFFEHLVGVAAISAYDPANSSGVATDVSNIIAKIVENTTGLKKGGCTIHLNSMVRDSMGKEPGFFDSFGSFIANTAALIPGNTPETEEAYITLEAFFKSIQKLSLATSKENKDESIYCKFDTSKISKGVIKFPYLASSDPHICLFPGGDPEVGEGYRGIRNFERVDNCILTDGVNLGKILVNVIYLNKTLTDLGKNVTIQDFIESVLKGINQASGNLWELTIIDTGDCSANNGVPEMSIIDMTKQKTPSVYVIPVKAFKDGGVVKQPAVVRGIDLKLQLTSAMQSQALYADTRNQLREDACKDTQLKKEQQGYKNLAAPIPATQPVKVDCGTVCEEPKDKDKPISEQLSAAMVQLADEINQSNKDNLYTKLVQYYASDSEQNQCNEMIVPFELSLTFDGIGGFSFGQTINCDLIPQKQQSRYIYQVTSVDQELNYGDWTTVIKAVARYKP